MKHKAMQRQIYRFIVQCVKEQGYPPSVREIGDAVGLKSPSTVHFHWLTRDTLKRAPEKAARCAR